MTTPKGERRRTAIVAAAARLIRSEGPAAVTHRRVAKEADVPLAATTYYFSDRDDLLAAAGAHLAAAWARAAERIATQAESDNRKDSCVDDVITALLPRRDADILGHYEHLVSSGRIPALADAYRDGRARLDDAVARLLVASRSRLAADLVVAVVDGAVVSALNEGRPARAEARRLLAQLLDGGC